MSQNRVNRWVTVINSQGLHARPADLLVRTANQFGAEIRIGRDHEEFDAKSILSILGMGAVQGTRLTISAVDKDAGQAVDALAQLFSRAFDEELEAAESTENTNPAGNDNAG